MILSLVLVGALAAGPPTADDPGQGLHVTVAGRGPAVVLVTGLLGASTGFEALASEIVRSGRRAVTIEPLGVGGSGRPRDADYSLTAQAGRVAVVLDSLDAGPALVVGHAVAAAIAYRLAAARPDLVRGVVALEGGAPLVAATPALARALRFAPLIRIFGGRGRVRRLFARELAAASADPSWVSEAVVTEYTRGPLEDLGAAIAAYRAMSRAREPVPLDEVLTRVRCPVLILRGEAGRVPDAEVELVRSRVDEVSVRWLTGAGVYLHEERPAAVAEAIVAFDPAPARRYFLTRSRRHR